MKLLANENLPIGVLLALKQKGFEIASVLDTGIGLKDEDVLRLAREQGRIILTFDKDFGKLAFKKGEDVKGIILLRFTPRSPEYIAERIESLLKTKEISFDRQFVVVTEDRVRVTPIIRK